MKKDEKKERFSFNCMLYMNMMYGIPSYIKIFTYSHDYISTIFIRRTKERVKHFILMCFLCVHFIFCLDFFVVDEVSRWLQQVSAVIIQC